jgi:hypothetical protein
LVNFIVLLDMNIQSAIHDNSSFWPAVTGKAIFVVVIPVHFSKDHMEMLAPCKVLIEYRSGYVAFNLGSPSQSLRQGLGLCPLDVRSSTNEYANSIICILKIP